MHMMAHHYSERANSDLQRHMRSFLQSMTHTLPCPECRRHAQRYLAQHAAQLRQGVRSREGLKRFLWQMHCHVNQLSRKPCPTWHEVAHQYGKRYVER